MRFAYIEAEKANYETAFMCRHLQVSKSGFYAWRRREESVRARRDRELLCHIRAIHQRSRRNYGSPRVHAELRAQGLVVGKNRVARLMRQDGLKSRRRKRYRRTTPSIAPGLHCKLPSRGVGSEPLRRFRIPSPSTLSSHPFSFAGR